MGNVCRVVTLMDVVLLTMRRCGLQPSRPTRNACTCHIIHVRTSSEAANVPNDQVMLDSRV